MADKKPIKGVTPRPAVPSSKPSAPAVKPAAHVSKPSATVAKPVAAHKPVARTRAPLSVLFARENYRLMVIGGVIVVLGMFLMTGGKNQDPHTFDPNLTYSTMRITVAPIMIVLGLLVEIYAIFKNPKAKQP